jgi:glycerol-3-phosphate dehydrogenase
MQSNPKRAIHKTQVLVIGGGVTGAGIVRDLALRGVDCVLVERADLAAGASGANHGLLHSGARYIATDPKSAHECHEENQILKRVAPHCIESCGGIYLAVEGDEGNYIADFAGRCEAAGVPVEPLDLNEAKQNEPGIAANLVAAYSTQDASIDPFRLVMDNLAHAKSLGCRAFLHSQVQGFKIERGRVALVELKNLRTGGEFAIEADQVINAAGAWVGEVAALAGLNINIVFSKGTLLVAGHRITGRCIMRLRKPADADALVPGGTVSLIGPTSVRLDNLDNIRPTVDEVDTIIEGSVPMVPELGSVRYIRAFSGVRPLIAGQNVNDDRNASRGFDLICHESQGVTNLTTVAGGKLSIYRIMAEKLCDLICPKLGVSAPCRTRTEPLPDSENNRWTEPGASPKAWIERSQPNDHILCECELVSKSVLEEVLAALNGADQMNLTAIGLRSRIGKGPCQGITCGARVSNYLIENHGMGHAQAITGLRNFLNGRWKGERTVAWASQQVQAELKEAIYCGFLELQNQPQGPGQKV